MDNRRTFLGKIAAIPFAVKAYASQPLVVETPAVVGQHAVSALEFTDFLNAQIPCYEAAILEEVKTRR